MTSCGGGSASGEREREQGERRRARESESGAGQLCGFVRGIEGVRGKQEVASRGGGGARACRRASGTRRSPIGEEDDRGGGARWAGPPVGWAGLLRLGCTGEAPGKPLLLYFCFLFFFDICLI